MIINVTCVSEFFEKFSTEEACIEHLEDLRWLNGVVISPYDENSKVYKCKNNRYYCKNTNRYFNVKTGTLFDNTKISLRKWFIAIYFVTNHKKGISSHQLARDLGVTQKTAWFMLHRIRNCFGEECIECLTQEVEADETFVGGKNKNRHGSRKVRGSQGRSVKDKVPVFGMVQRGGAVFAKVVKDTKSSTLLPEIYKSIKKDSYIYTDEWNAYVKLNLHYNHNVVLHNKGEYVVGKAHTNTIEGFWSHLKRMIVGIHHWVSGKHLQLYVDSQCFRYNTRKVSDFSRFNILLRSSNKRLKYKTLICGEI